jgi:hypothetical protein
MVERAHFAANVAQVEGGRDPRNRELTCEWDLLCKFLESQARNEDISEGRHGVFPFLYLNSYMLASASFMRTLRTHPAQPPHL